MSFQLYIIRRDGLSFMAPKQYGLDLYYCLYILNYQHNYALFAFWRDYAK